MFYVYMLTDPRKNNQPFYIGKGQGNRAYKHGVEKCKYNQFKNNVITAIRKRGLEHGVVILREFTDEKDALDFEIEMISKYGRRKLDPDGILANRSLGGEGTTGYKFTECQLQNLSKSHIGLKQSDETKKKRSEKLRGIKRSDELKKQWSESKMGEKNPMFGKKSHRKGMTYEEEFGVEKALELKTIIKAKRALQIDSDETRKKKSESAKRAHANGVNRFAGKMWITNGIENKVVSDSYIIEEGWRKGKTKRKSTSKNF